MKNILTSIIFLFLFINTFGQFNPVNNLTFEHWYHYESACPNFNCFDLSWAAPDTLPQDTLVGYNIYRDSVLWRFQDYIGASCSEAISICPDEDFIFFAPTFWIKVKAVYNLAHLESIANDSAYFEGMFTNVKTIEDPFFMILENPVKRGHDIIIQMKNIQEKDFDVMVYNNEGRNVEAIIVEANSEYFRIAADKYKAGIYNLVFIFKKKVLSARILIL